VDEYLDFLSRDAVDYVIRFSTQPLCNLLYDWYRDMRNVEQIPILGPSNCF